jgi:hypothetical protein
MNVCGPAVRRFAQPCCGSMRWRHPNLGRHPTKPGPLFDPALPAGFLLPPSAQTDSSDQSDQIAGTGAQLVS